ncbi:hypothetical protein LSPH24S_01585 [Lysinibacillus sphaericus]
MLDRFNHESHDKTSNDMEQITDEKWQAIINNDPTYNHQFFYAVKSTGSSVNHLVNRASRKKKMSVFFKTQNKLYAQISGLVNVASQLMKNYLIANGSS